MYTFRQFVIIANIIFFLWLLWNGIDEGFRAKPVEMASLLVLMVLLLVNAALLIRLGKRSA